jgi:CheY-like chemotaxis protein/anti-sigma regulatory factor (Ser/Thr protein kinase)
VRQLLSHLVANAVKFTHTGSVELSVSIKRAGTGTDWLVAEVRDTGVGIPTEKLETIFESFRQGESGLARSYAGLGLGLALVRKLITLMNGEISVVSTPGVGSTFTMRLPLRPPAETIAASSEGQSQPLATILAVEDNPVGLMVLHRALQRHHIKVDGAPSGRAALEAAAKQRYDLVLMDLQMPEMDGLETATAMRELPGYKTVPILALTANASDELRDVCLQRGMQAFLPKPFDTKVLLAAISKFVKKDA